MIRYYWANTYLHYLINSAVLGLFIVGPVLATALLVTGLSFLILFVLTILALSDQNPPVMGSLVLIIFFAACILSMHITPMLQPWVTNTLLPALITPSGFIGVLISLVSLTTTLCTKNEYSPFHLLFYQDYRRSFTEKYRQHKQREAAVAAAQHHFPTPSAPPAPILNDPVASQPTVYALATSLDIIKLDATHTENVRQRQIRALAWLDTPNVGLKSEQIELRMRLNSQHLASPECPLSLSKFNTEPTGAGYLFKEKYNEIQEQWEFVPGYTQFFIYDSLCQYCEYHAQGKRMNWEILSNISHPVNTREFLYSPTEKTRFLFIPTQKISREYDCLLNPEIIYYAERIQALEKLPHKFFKNTSCLDTRRASWSNVPSHDQIGGFVPFANEF